MNLLQLVVEFCGRTGIPAPATVADSRDAQIIQIKALCNELCEDLADKSFWQNLTVEAVFNTVANEDQGSIFDIADGGYQNIINETIFNRTLRLPVFGPMSPQQWQTIKALPNTGPFYKYRLRGDRVLFNPTPPAGQICAFEYRSSWLVRDSVGVPKQLFTNDLDTPAVPDAIFLAGLRWKWKYEKGLDYAEEFRRYEELVTNAGGRDGTKPRISMDQCSQDFRPGIWVSAGNWPLP